MLLVNKNYFGAVIEQLYELFLYTTKILMDTKKRVAKARPQESDGPHHKIQCL